MKQGIVSRLNDSTFHYQGWPTVCRDDEGVLYVGSSSFRLGHVCGFGKNVLYTSRDGGESWSCPKVFNDDILDDRDVGLCYMGGKKIMATWFSLPTEYFTPENIKKWVERSGYVTEPLFLGALEYWKRLPADKIPPFGNFCKVTEDGGETWSETRPTPVTSPHGPILLKNGKILYFGKVQKRELLPYETDYISVYESEDDGKSWSYITSVKSPVGCGEKNLHEPYAIELADGTVFAMIRAEGEEISEALGEMNDDLKEYKFTMFKTFSHDGGRSWSDPEPVGFLGAPPHMLLHSSGAVILTYSRRKVGVEGIFARVSHDGGKTFGEETLIGPKAKIWDQGYPSTVELDDGSLITVYYQRYEDDDYCSLLYTKYDITELK